MNYDDLNFRRVLTAQIKEQIAISIPIIVNGECQTIEDYKYRSGQVHALNRVLDMIEGILDEARNPNTPET